MQRAEIRIPASERWCVCPLPQHGGRIARFKPSLLHFIHLCIMLFINVKHVKMKSESQQMRAEDLSEPEVRAIGQRFKTYLDSEWRANQSTLADKVGVSQPAISRVAAGEQLPSGKLLLALSKNTNLNVDWLLRDRGAMLLREGRSLSGKTLPAIPIVEHPLPGPPKDHASLLAGESLAGCGINFGPTQYWLRLHKNDPITRVNRQNVLPGDLVLLETNRELFPEPESILEELWLIRIKSADKYQYTLAEVSDVGEGLFEADTFDLESPGRQEIVLRPLPGGKFTGSTRAGRRKGRAGRLIAREPPKLGAYPPLIKVDDLVARKLAILRR
jgi:transcriptional regulator with XRE-family HTH domain